MKACVYCKIEKDKEHFPKYGTLCKDCKKQRAVQRHHVRKVISQAEMIGIISAIDMAMKTKNKAALVCACKDAEKFCDKYSIRRSDSVDG